MKKVKIMLMVITVMAVTSGVLAFKAKFNTVYCTAEPSFNGTFYYCPTVACTESIITAFTSQTLTTTNPDFVCTTLNQGVACDNELCTFMAITTIAAF